MGPSLGSDGKRRRRPLAIGHEYASMGPSLGSDGKGGAHEGQTNQEGFNGAVAWERRKADILLR